MPNTTRVHWPGFGLSFRVRERVVWILSALLSVAVVYVALRPVATFVAIALARLGYPYELEWMEGGIVTHVQVVLSGGHLYRAPSLSFTPYIYTPLYYYVSALASLVFGVGYFAPRLVSFVSILGAFSMLGYLVRRETDSLVAALAAVGVFAATYGITGFWFDVARVDSLLVLMLLSGYALCRYVTTTRFAVLAGVVLGATFFAKQNGLLLAAPALVHLLLRAPRLGLRASAAFAAVVGGGIFALDHASDDWFYYYAFEVPRRHLIDWDHLETAAREYLWSPVAMLTVSGGAVLCGVGLGGKRFSTWVMYAGLVLVGCSGSLVALLHTGSYENAMIPAYAALSIAFGIELGALRRAVQRASFRSVSVLAFALAAVLLQCSFLSYSPAKAIPTARDRIAMKRVIRQIATLPRPMFVTASSYYSVLAGQPDIVTPTMGVADVLKAHGLVERDLRETLVQQIRAHRFRTMVLDRATGFFPPDLVDEIKRAYHPVGHLFAPEDDDLWPVCGASVRPDDIWEAN